MSVINDLIRDHAMLATYHTKCWSASQNDRAASKVAADAQGAKASAYKTVKNLMAGNDLRLKAVRGALEEGRRVHNEHTMVWGSSNQRMLPTAKFIDYMQAMGAAKNAFNLALTTFTDNYEADAELARDALNITDTNLYPSKDSMARFFSFEIGMEPIAAGATFNNLPPAAMDALTKKFEGTVTRRYSEALNRVRTELGEAVDLLRNHLRKDEPKFRNTAVYNPVATAKNMITFDIRDDNEDTVEVCQQIANALDGYDDKSLTKLRKSPLEDREKVCRQLDNIFDALLDLEL